MIATGTNVLKDAITMGEKLKAEINCQYRCLEIEIDGVFKSLLLLKKKKYAALKIVDWLKPTQKEVREIKGIDLVRRDWSGLSRRVSTFMLGEVMSGKPKDEI